MNPNYKKNIFAKAAIGIPPQLETPVSVVDCCASTMALASGGEFVKRDKIHLDKSAKGESFNTLIPPRDIFEADATIKGLGAYLREQINEVGSVENSPLTPTASESPAPAPSEELPLNV